MSEDKNKEIDEISGVETTGHEWDGLKELNNPLPRWWLWVFFICVIWSVWYFVVYPAWPVPGGATEGTSGYTQYKELHKNQQEIFARQQVYLDQFEKSSFQEIMDDPGLYSFAMAGGASAFKDNCATCHGTGAEGSKGYPNLNDDDWIWGGTLNDIYTTLLHGIRADNIDTRLSQMPAFGKDKLLNRDQINDVVEYVMSLSQGTTSNDMAGYQIFQQNCATCHGDNGKGLREFGAPNLTDGIWLYGEEKKDIYYTIFNSRAGMMPSWKNRLDDNTIRQLAVYVHQLGGGEEEALPEQPLLMPVKSVAEEKMEQDIESLIPVPDDEINNNEIGELENEQ